MTTVTLTARMTAARCAQLTCAALGSSLRGALRFASAGSGSEGNALLVEAGVTRILIDCGFALKELRQRLARLHFAIESLTAIVVTHEHSDHASGVARLARQLRIPVWLTHGTLRMLGADMFAGGELRLLRGGMRVAVGALEVEAFTVPHDAREPVQFIIGNGSHRLGVLTDAGCSTPHIEACLSGCHALVLECNHERELLEKGPYPPGLKRRVASRVGHLDNQAAAHILRNIDCSKLQHIVAAHLSKQNNTPEHARRALSAALNCSTDWIGIANQETGFGWRELLS